MSARSDWDLTGKVALVTGDRMGWTPHFAAALAEAGAVVALAGHAGSDVHDAALAVRAHGREALVIEADLTRSEDVDRVTASATARFGRIDILVNNAHVDFGKPLVETTDAEWDAVMDFNLRSTFLLCRAVGRLMLAQGGGRIINIGSGLAERGLVNSTAACAAQGAIKQFTAALGLEWARDNVRVNGIGAGWLSTESPSEEDLQELLVRFIPSKRKGHPSDLCGLLVYLCSDACDFVTGQMVYVDGGAMAHA